MRHIVVSGMFRSGTTLVWRVLSADPEIKEMFCEPLHQNLPDEIQKYEHYEDYKNHPKAMEKWSPNFHTNRLRLKSGDSYEEMSKYLSNIILQDSVSKFTRLNLRFPWFIKNFSEPFLINLIRDPRAVCYSHLKPSLESNFWDKFHPFKGNIDSKGIRWNKWNSEDYFKSYQVQLPKWQSYLNKLETAPPYIKIMALWRVNVEQSIADLKEVNNCRSITITYEEIVTNPKTSITKIYNRIGKDPPSEVLDNALGRKTEDLGGHKKWQTEITDKWVNEYTKISSEIWDHGIQKSGILDLMKHFEYV